MLASFAPGRVRVLAPLVLALVAVSGCFKNLPQDEPLARPVNYKGQFWPFPTGARAVFFEDPDASRLQVLVSYDAGAVDESNDQRGAAHLLEHLTFRARHGGAGSATLAERLTAVGATFNAYTLSDRTEYWSLVPADGLAEVLALENARFSDPLAGIDEAEFLRAKEVVIAELREREATHKISGQFQWALAAALDPTPYGRPIGGEIAQVSAITLEQVKQFWADHYRADRTVIVVIGSLNQRQVHGALTGKLGKVLAVGERAPAAAPWKRPVLALQAPSPEKRPLSALTRRVPVDKPRLWLSWAVPGELAGNVAQTELCSRMLESLLDEIPRDTGLSRVEVVPVLSGGAGAVVAVLDIDDETKAQGVLDAARGRLDTFHWERARQWGSPLGTSNEMVRDEFLALENLSAMRVADYLRRTGKPDYVSGWPAELRGAVANGRPTDFGAATLNADRARVVFVAPPLAGTREPANTATAEHASAFDERFMSESDAVLANAPLQISGLPGLDKGVRFQLRNGMSVELVHYGAMPIVDARLVLRTRPSAAYPDPRIAWLATELSWVTFNRHWRAGGSMYVLPNDGQVSVGVWGTSGNLPHFLDDLRRYTSEPYVQGGWLDGLKEYREKYQRQEEPDAATQRILFDRLYPQHLYGADLSLTRNLGNLQADMLRDWVANEVRPENVTLLLVGDVVDSPELRKDLDDQLGGWSAQRAPPPPVKLAAPGLPKPREVLVIDRPGASQVAIHLGIRGPQPTKESPAIAETFSEVLGDQLDRRLRQGKGLAYGVRVRLDDHPLADAFLIDTEVAREKATDALFELLDRTGQLADEALPEGEVNRVKYALLRGYDLRFATLTAVSAKLEELERAGRPADYWESYPFAVGNVTPEQLRDYARGLALGNEVVLLQGDAKTLVPELQRQGLTATVVK